MTPVAFVFVAFLAGVLAVPLVNDDVEFNFEGRFSGDDFADTDIRIIGGSLTTIQEHPYQINFRRAGRLHCGGSLITQTRALTAAHCLLNNVSVSEYSIMAGSTLRYGDGGQQIRSIASVLRHPRFNEIRRTYDIGLLFWKKPLISGAAIRPITMPMQSAPLPYGKNCNLTGWGTTEEGDPASTAGRLKVTSVPLLSRSECKRAYGDRITYDRFCAGLPQGGRGACQSDSGAPLVRNGILIGVVSGGIGCAAPGSPNIYVDVAFFSNWIRTMPSAL